MSSLLVQIPCLNEELNISEVIKSIPRFIPGFRRVDVLVIDDGSSDRTVERAIEAGADIVISSASTAGLARSFALGLEFCLAEGYEVMVNTDGDNQYHQEKIPMLVEPITLRLADIVVGDRDTDSLKHFSLGKRFLQKVGSRVLAFASGMELGDAASGFRAYSRLAMSRLFIATSFSYAMEVLIQAGHKGLRVQHVVTGAKFVERPSRLFKNSHEHIIQSARAILKSYLLHNPIRIFGVTSIVLALAGSIPFIRYLFLLFSEASGDHIQSLILGSVLVMGSLLAAALGVIAQISKFSRELLENSISLNRIAGRDTKDVLGATGCYVIHDSRV